MDNLTVVKLKTEYVITPVPTQQLHVHWPDVSDVLNAHLSKHESEWLAEDAYHDLRCGKTTLFRGRGKDFMICEMFPELRGPVLWVWFAYSKVGGVHYWASVVRLAEEAGACKIRFATPIKSWERLARKYGFEEKRRIYEMRL